MNITADCLVEILCVQNYTVYEWIVIHCCDLQTSVGFGCWASQLPVPTCVSHQSDLKHSACLHNAPLCGSSYDVHTKSPGVVEPYGKWGVDESKVWLLLFESVWSSSVCLLLPERLRNLFSSGAKLTWLHLDGGFGFPAKVIVTLECLLKKSEYADHPRLTSRWRTSWHELIRFYFHSLLSPWIIFFFSAEAKMIWQKTLKSSCHGSSCWGDVVLKTVKLSGFNKHHFCSQVCNYTAIVAHLDAAVQLFTVLVQQILL